MDMRFFSRKSISLKILAALISSIIFFPVSAKITFTSGTSLLHLSKKKNKSFGEWICRDGSFAKDPVGFATRLIGTNIYPQIFELEDDGLGLTRDVETNSWGLIHLEERIEVLETLTKVNSNAIVSHSGHLENLDQRLVATTDAVTANSWAIVDLTNEVFSTNQNVENNSWAILAINTDNLDMLDDINALDGRVDVLEGKVTELVEHVYLSTIDGIGDVCETGHKIHGADVYSLDWTPNANSLAMGGVTSSGVSVRVFYSSSPGVFDELVGCRLDHGGTIRSVAWHPSGEFLAVGGDEGTDGYNLRIYSYDDVSFVELTSCRINTPGSVFSIAWTSDGWNLAVAGADVGSSNNVQVYWFNRWSEILTLVPGCSYAHGASIYSVDWDHTAQHLALAGDTGTGDFTVRVLDFSVGSSTLTIEADCNIDFDTTVKAVVWHPLGNTIFAGSAEGHIYAYKFENGQDVVEPCSSTLVQKPRALISMVSSINSLDLASAGSVLVVGKDAGDGCSTIGYLFNGTSLNEIIDCRVDKNFDNVKAIAISPGETYVAISGDLAIDIDIHGLAKGSLISANSWAISDINQRLMSNVHSGDVLYDDESLVLHSGSDLEGVCVCGQNTKIAGSAHVTDSIVLSDASTSVYLGLLGSVDGDIVLNGGSVILDSDLKLADGYQFDGAGVVRANGHKISLGTHDLEMTGSIHFIDAGDLEFHGINKVSGILTFEGDSYIEGNGGVLDLSLGGTIWVKQNTDLDLINLTLDGLGSGYIVFEDKTSKIYMVNSDIGMDTDYTFTTGGIYVGTEATVFVHEYSMIFEQDATLTVDGATLWYDPVGYTGDDFGISPLIEDQETLFFLNSGLIAKVGETASFVAVRNLAYANSAAIVAHSGHMVNLDERLVAATDAVTSHSGHLINLDKRIIENSNAIFANSWSISDLVNEITNANQHIAENSWAILALEERHESLEEDVGENSWAIESLSEAVESLDVRVLSNSGKIVRHEDAIFIGGVAGLGDAFEYSHVSHGDNIRSLDWCPSGYNLAMGGDRTSNISVRVWHRSYEIALEELPGCQIDHGEDIRAVAWHPSGEFLAIGGDNGTGNYNVRIYSFDGTTLTELTGCNIDTTSSVYSLAWTSDGLNLAVGGADVVSGEDVRIYWFDCWAETLTFVTGCGYDHGGTIYSLDWDVNNRYLALAGADGASSYNLRVLDFTVGTSTLAVEAGCNVDFDTTARAVKWHPTGNYLFAGTEEDNIKGYSFDGTNLTALPGTAVSNLGNVNSFDLISTGSTIFVGNDDGADGFNIVAYSFDGSSLSEIIGARVTQGVGDVDAIAIMPGDNYLAVAGDPSIALDIYPILQGSLIAANSAAINSSSWAIQALDDRLDVVEPLLVATSDGVHANSWAIADLVNEVAISNQGIEENSWAIFALDDLYNETAEDLATLEGRVVVLEYHDAKHEADIYKGTISTIGDSCAPGTKVHGADIYSLSWTPNSNSLAMGGVTTSDISIRVWRSPSPGVFEELLSCQIDHGGDIRSVAWHPSGEFLAVGGDNGTGDYNVRIFSYDENSLTELTSCRIDTPGSVHSIAWTSDGWNLAVAGVDVGSSKNVQVYWFDRWAETLTLVPGCSYAHGASIYSVDWDCNNKYLALAGATGTNDYTVRVLDFTVGTSSLAVETGCNVDFDTTAKVVTWHPLGTTLFVGSEEAHIYGYKFQNQQLLQRPRCLKSTIGGISSLDLISTGSVLVVGKDAGDDCSTLGYLFNGTSLGELSGCRVDDGTSNVNVAAIRPGDIYIALAGDAAIKLTIQGLEKASLIEANSWAVEHLHENFCAADFGARDLLGDESFTAGAGTCICGLAVSGTSNRLLGQPQFTDNIVLENASTEFSVGIQSSLDANVTLNGGTIDLECDLRLSDGYQFLGDGIIRTNGHKLSFGTSDLDLTGTLHFYEAGDLDFYGIKRVSGILIFEGESYINGNGGRLDLTPGGTIWVKQNTNLHLLNLKIVGLGDGHFVFEDKTSIMYWDSVSEVEMKSDYTFTTGGIYANYSTTVITGQYAMTFDLDSTLTVDGVTLWYDTLIYTGDDAGIFPYMYDGINTFFVNDGLIVKVGESAFVVGVSQLTKANSNAIISHSGHLINLDERVTDNSSAILANSLAIDSHYDLLVYNSNSILAHSNTINADHDLLVHDSNAINAHYDLLVAVSDASNANSWAISGLVGEVATINLGIEDNSWAILALDDRLDIVEPDVIENSWAIQALDDRLDVVEPLLEATSNAVNAHYDLLVHNSNAIDSHYDLLVNNSWAIKALEDDASILNTLVVENSNAVYANSWAISYIQDLTSNLIIENSNAIYVNSWAIKAHDDRLGIVEPLLEATSNAVNAHYDLLVHNSNAIDSHYDLLVNNSWAI
ncbi:hypothetical protein KAU11_02640, partial [Candidatus Babeliales bacterium]|nr:hypothetical protein [Candidatus Babeliales bacterium]